MIPLHQTPLRLREALAFPKGDYLSKLKDAFLTKFNKQYAVLTADARNAIYLALKAMKLRPQDEVIIPGYICQAVRVAIEAICRPVYVDIDRRSFNINPEDIERHITRSTKAILAAHLYGNPCQMDRIIEIAKANNLLVIEDAAQALGGKYQGKMLGSFGDFTIFSFRFSKDITCFRGGALLTNEKIVAELEPAGLLQVIPGLFVTLLALGQISNTPAFIYSGLRSRLLVPYFSHNAAIFNQRQETLSNYQCYLLYQQLLKIDSIIAKRRRNAAYYSEKLGDMVVTPEATEGGEHTYYRYTIQLDNRDQLCHYLLKRGIEADKMYDYSLAAADVSPGSALAARRNLNIPVHHKLSQTDIDRVIEAIHKFNKSRQVVSKA